MENEFSSIAECGTELGVSLLDWIEFAENGVGERITHILLDERGGEVRRLLTRDEFETDRWATERFSSGFSGPGCSPLVAWSTNWVFYVSEYDGSTDLCKLPRGPTLFDGFMWYGDCERRMDDLLRGKEPRQER